MITKKYEQIKQIRCDRIDANRLRAQARQGDACPTDIKEMASSIEAIGLQEPISVEIKHWDDVNPQYSIFILRDGNHRFKAYETLRNKHKSSTNYDLIKCVVYEENTGPQAECEWLDWQHAQNLHLDKVHKKGSKEDTINTLSMLLKSGFLCSKAKNAIDNNNWNDSSIRSAIQAWFKEQKGKWTFSEKDYIIDQVSSGKISPIIKRYTRKDLTDILEDKFGVYKSGERGSHRVGNKKIRAWHTSGDDMWTKAASPIMKLCQDGHNDYNIIINHSKSINPDTIKRERATLTNLVNDINTFFSKSVKGFKNKKLINQVFHLGQILKDKNGKNYESVNNLMKPVNPPLV